MNNRRGVILAGGNGTRLNPMTTVVSKQLLPVYDKPMIYYPLSVLMQANIREILVICRPNDLHLFKRLLGNGSQWGLDLAYKIQKKPDGLPQAYILAEEFLDGCPSALILGDNIFYGHGLNSRLINATQKIEGATVFASQVSDPERYGVANFTVDGRVIDIIEKPKDPPSNYAVTGLYFLDGSAPERAKGLKPSSRGELEITDLLRTYIDEGALSLEKLGSGFAWLDTGTPDSLLDASNFVRTLSKRQGLQVSSPIEIAISKGWIAG